MKTIRTTPSSAERHPSTPDLLAAARGGSIVIERVEPAIDDGRHAVKRIVGDTLRVTADIFADGHGVLAAALLIRADDEDAWSEIPMRLVDNDRWSGSAALERTGAHRYTIEAWRDVAETWRARLLADHRGGVSVDAELTEGRLLLDGAATAAEASDAASDAELLRDALARDRTLEGADARVAVLTDEDVIAAARRHAPRRDLTRHDVELPLSVDRPRARFSAWYELFPRSQGRDPARPQPTTFDDAIWRLADVAAMGFDVVYLPPIHPIGSTNRKGPNNSLPARPGDPGSPWAIGSPEGGHDAVAPELGGLPAFERFSRAASDLGMELALDLALQASPDHPWVAEHPEWFRHEADGSIRYAENPPKRYQDVYPLDLAADDPAVRAAVWQACLAIIQTWVDRGVRIFRVDNPHTKPMPFWRWLIGTVQRADPDTIFLAEAFTKPKMMRALAKAGFTQGYTYFTWRETRDELREYLVELTETEMRDYFRASLWPNTPDIFPHHLDLGRAAFATRAVLAATLSPSWGIYSGFELCERGRLGEREEYADSEKYEIRARDWDARGGIKGLITGLNRVRREQPALQLADNLRFESVTGDRALFYRKALPDGEIDPLTGFPNRWRDPVYAVVSCDVSGPEEAILHPDLPAIGIGWDEPYEMVDLLTGRLRRLRGADIPVELHPARLPYRLFTIRPVASARGG